MAGVVRGVFHPVVSVSDMAESLTYYRDVLGLEVTFDDYHDPAAIESLFGLPEPRLHSVIVGCPDGSEIELVEWERPRGVRRVARSTPDAGILSINLRVSDLEAIVERLIASGYRPFSQPVTQRLPDGGDIKVQVCRAPDDVTLILVELPPGRASLSAP